MKRFMHRWQRPSIPTNAPKQDKESFHNATQDSEHNQKKNITKTRRRATWSNTIDNQKLLAEFLKTGILLDDDDDDHVWHGEHHSTSTFLGWSQSDDSDDDLSMSSEEYSDYDDDDTDDDDDDDDDEASIDLSRLKRRAAINASTSLQKERHPFEAGFEFAKGVKLSASSTCRSEQASNSFPRIDFGTKKTKRKVHKHAEHVETQPELRLLRSRSFSGLGTHESHYSAYFPRPRHHILNQRFDLPSCFQPLDRDWEDANQSLSDILPDVSRDDVLVGLQRIAMHMKTFSDDL